MPEVTRDTPGAGSAACRRCGEPVTFDGVDDAASCPACGVVNTLELPAQPDDSVDATLEED